MSVPLPQQNEESCPIAEREKTIAMSLETRKKLAELMDQIDETVIALRAEIEHAKMRRGTDDNL